MFQYLIICQSIQVKVNKTPIRFWKPYISGHTCNQTEVPGSFRDPRCARSYYTDRLYAGIYLATMKGMEPENIRDPKQHQKKITTQVAC